MLIKHVYNNQTHSGQTPLFVPKVKQIYKTTKQRTKREYSLILTKQGKNHYSLKEYKKKSNNHININAYLIKYVNF